MRVTYTPGVNAAYITFRELAEGEVITRSVEVVPDQVLVDFDAEGRIVGMDVQYATDNLPPQVLEEAEVIG